MFHHPRVTILLVAALAPAALALAGRTPPDAPVVLGVLAFMVVAASAVVVIAIPGVGALGVVLRQSPQLAVSPAFVVSVVVVASSLQWWLTFWLWAVWAPVGVFAAVVGYGAGALLAAGHGSRLSQLGAPPLGLAAVPLATVLMANGVLFARGGLADPLAWGQSIYGMADNWFPHEWVNRLLVGGDLRAPMLGGWPAADRPPVQAALTLPVAVVGGDWPTASHIAGSVLQGIGMLGVVVVVHAVGARGWRLVVAGLAVACTPFVAMGTAFVWPKLFASGLLLLAAAIFLDVGSPAAGRVSERGRPAPTRPPRGDDGSAVRVRLAGPAWAAVLGLVAVSIVAHPTGLLAVPLVVVAANRHRVPWPPLRWLPRAAVVPMVFVGGWFGYRVFFDPSVSTVAQWHLAGLLEPRNDDPLLAVIVDRYREVGFVGALQGRLSNLATITGVRFIGAQAELGLDTSLPGALRRSFAVPAFTPGVLILASPLLWWWRRLTRGTLTVLLGGVLAVVGWLLVTFGPPVGATVTTHGPYAAFLALAAVLALAVVTVLPRWCAVVLLGLQGAVWLAAMVDLAGALPCRRSTMCVPFDMTSAIEGGRGIVWPVLGVAVVGVGLLAASLGVLGRSPSGGTDDPGAGVPRRRGGQSEVASAPGGEVVIGDGSDVPPSVDELPAPAT